MPPDNVPSSREPSQPGLFRFETERQEQIYNRLRTLVGPGAGEFYKDACRHMAIQPPFTATTHLVSHLLREIESALRDVLEAITGRMKNTGNADENHRNEIGIILKELGFKDDDLVAKAWLSLTDGVGLDKRTHRQNLDAPRPVDSEFEEFWAKMETILDTVLERFEGKYTKVFKTLDALAKKNDPSEDDAKSFHQHIPNNRTAHQHFFKGLVINKKWLSALRAKDIFKIAPGPEHFQDGSYRYPDWPEVDYLKNAAAIEPEIVSEILGEIDPSGNAYVQGKLLEIAAILPAAHRATIMPKIKTWMREMTTMFMSKASTDLILKLVDEGNTTEALELSEIFLEILPSPNAATPPTERVYGAPYEPRTRTDEWQYAQFIKDEFQRVVLSDSWGSLELLLTLMSKFLEFKYAYEKLNYHDSTYISRPAIEDHEQNHMHDDAEDSLITGIREIALNIVKNDSSALEKVVTLLESKKWTVFRRIALLVLSKYSKLNPELTARYSTDKTLFEDHELRHEYLLLLATSFPTLTSDQQAIVLGWIDRAEEIEERVSGATPPLPDASVDAFRKNWQRDKFSIIGEHLTGEWKTRYEDLLKDIGAPEHPDFPTYHTSFSGPTSETNAHSLSEMDTDDLIEYLKTWEPAENRYGFGPTKEGLGRELTQAVILKPQQFEAIAERFKELDPTYVRAFFQGFHDIDITNWEQIYSLSEWVMSQPRDIAGRTTNTRMDQDTGWGWTKRTISSMLSRGVQKNLMPFEQRSRVWTLIEWLTEDPDPTIADDEKRGESFADDAYSYTINTSRGEAMEAAVQYALWVYRETAKTEEGKESLKAGFALMPEVRTLLQKHLDSDPSPAIRAVYGRYLPWLQLIDRVWVEEHLDQIMPAGEFNTPLYLAAWSGYVMHVGAFDDVLPLLREKYKEAIANITIEKTSRRYSDRNMQLIEHLMIYYMRGRIAFDDELSTLFWSSAPSESKGYALDFIGRNLASNSNKADPLPPDTVKRLQELWESRVTLAEASVDKAEYKEEMEAFGWWFASEKFPEKWSCDQYLRALAIAGNKTQVDHLVAERLLGLAESLPVEVVAILRKIILTERTSWILLGNKDEVRTILTTILRSPIAGAHEAAEDLINRLAAHGYPDFGDLLESE
jgi:hypothetical protein